VCVPPEERDGVLAFLDLKLDLLIRPDSQAEWLDQDEYTREVEASTISASWQRSVEETMEALDRARRSSEFHPTSVAQYRPPRAPSR
jgi:predicted RNA-binding protein associated with RNAse of E/G family